MTAKEIERDIENLKALLTLSLEPPTGTDDQPLSTQQTEQFTTILSNCSINPVNVAEIQASVNCSYEESFTYSKYLGYLHYLLLKITSNLHQLHDDKSHLKDSLEIITGILNCYKIGIKPFKQKPLDDRLTNRFIGNINALANIIANLQTIACTQEKEIYFIFKELLICIFALIPIDEQPNQIKCENILNMFLQRTPTARFFRTLFLLQAELIASVNEQKTIHKYLSRCLYLPNGFTALCEGLLGVHKEDELRERWQSCTIISSIVGCRGHSIRFYKTTIEEIHRILLKYTNGDSSVKESYVEAAVHTLSKLYTLNNKVINEKIESTILGPLDKIISPEDLLNGTILLEENDFKQIIKIIYIVFCATGPSDVTLPSQLLIPYLPVFLQLYNVSESVQNAHTQHEIQSIIVRCLSNREKTELSRIIEALIFENYSSDMKTIHSLVSLNVIELNDKIATFSLKISSSENDTDSRLSQGYDGSSTLISILKASNHNILTYNVFVHLLHLLTILFVTNDSSQHNIDLFENMEDLMEFIKKNFQRKYSILNSLNELIMYKPLYNQIKSNPVEILDLLNNIIKDILKQLESKDPENEQIEEILLMVLSILDELNYKIKDNDDQIVKNLVQTLKHLRLILLEMDKFDVIARKLDAILQPQSEDKNPEYAKAFKILSEQSEPYSRAYAMKIILDLLDKRDVEAVANAYSILALSLKILKDKDSYVFLNCIKLLVSLMKVLEAPVLDALVAEYHLQGDDETEVDYKLKVGETIVKMTESLGEIAYKYKDTLISCFLNGSQHANNEFRMSNISNLGAILRLLSYQIHQNFQEIMCLIENTVTLDAYPPVRRASVQVLANFLDGVDNLENFEDYVLRIYRFLKKVVATDSDVQVRIHATNGLDTLKTKVINIFSETKKMEKEIKVFGINEPEISYKDLFKINKKDN